MIAAIADPTVFRIPITLLAKQEILLRSRAHMRCAWGAFGSGKTRIAALCAAQLALENAGMPGLITSATWSTLRESGLKALLEVLPKPLIRRYFKADKVLELTNGSTILMRSVKGLPTGLNVAWVWVDEVHLVRDGTVWMDLEGRARLKGAPRSGIITSGVPIEIAWMRQTFGRPEHYSNPTRCIVHMSVYDNAHNLDPHYLAQLVSSVGESDAPTLLGGEWRKHQDAAFPEFDVGRHVLPVEGDRTRPVHLTLDVGSQAVALVAQDRLTPDGKPGLMIVDEVISDDVLTDTLIARVKERGWRIGPPHSVICVDPRSHLDVLEAIRRNVPNGTKIIRRKQGDPAYDLGYGWRCVRAALKSADGVTRLWFSNKLPSSRRSILTALSSARLRPDGRSIHKDNALDHSADALRYLCCEQLPLKERGAGIKIVGAP